VSIKTEKELMGSWLICCGTKTASYTSDMGLLLVQPGTIPPSLLAQPKTALEAPFYELELFKDHAYSTMDCCNSVLSKYPAALARIALLLGIPVGILTQSVGIMGLLHDLGKLSYQWQKAARDWQRIAYPAVFCDSNAVLAHTTYKPENGDFQRQANLSIQRGPHALEGAFLASKAISNFLGPNVGIECSEKLTCIFMTAIGRHHNGRASKLSEFQLDSKAPEVLGELLASFGEKAFLGELSLPPGEREKEQIRNYLIQAAREEDEKLVVAYWFVVRCLRLADQEATRKGKRR
jgi:CRISPR-associated endonuclease/helicase Cas3